MQQQQQSPNYVNATYNLGSMVGAGLLPFISWPGTMGHYALNGSTLISLLAGFFIAGLAEPVGGFIVLFGGFFMCAVHRIAMARRERKGLPQPHSLYRGDPIIGHLLGLSPKWAEKWEQLTVVFAIVAALPFSPGLGLWLLISGTGLGLAFDREDRKYKAMVRAMRDAEIESAHVRNLFDQSKERRF